MYPAARNTHRILKTDFRDMRIFPKGSEKLDCLLPLLPLLPTIVPARRFIFSMHPMVCCPSRPPKAKDACMEERLSSYPNYPSASHPARLCDNGNQNHRLPERCHTTKHRVLWRETLTGLFRFSHMQRGSSWFGLGYVRLRCLGRSVARTARIPKGSFSSFEGVFMEW